MLTAKEAKEKGIEACQKKIANELEMIAQDINEAIAAGEMSCTVDKYVSKDTKQKLESLGYQVTSGTQYNESYTFISWRDA